MCSSDLTTLVHGEQAMQDAEATSAARFAKNAAAGELTQDFAKAPQLPAEAAGWPLWKLIKEMGWVASSSEARRLIQGGGVQIDGVRATSIDQPTSPGLHTFKLGPRRIYPLVIEAPKARSL